ncbi:MAG: hypothetical protein WCS93_05430 [Candidatus Delongbacteria bacterium]
MLDNGQEFKAAPDDRIGRFDESHSEVPYRVLQIGLPTGKIFDEKRIHEMDFRDAFEDGMY